jgi:hypothetical protein
MTARPRTLGLLVIALAVGLLAADERKEPEPRLRLLVPAYFHPSGDRLKLWDSLIGAADRAPIVIIANPASGPGRKADPNHRTVIRKAHKRGATVIGYISTRYAKRPATEVRAEIDRWVQFYPEVRGFFFDEQASDADHVGYYAGLREAARSKIDKALVVTNPGTTCAEDYISRTAADAACIFESNTGFDRFRPPDWTGRYPAGRFAILPYAINGADAMRAVIARAVRDRIGLVYITDDAGRNPWDRLPSYWDAEVDAVARANQAEQP